MRPFFMARGSKVSLGRRTLRILILQSDLELCTIEYQRNIQDIKVNCFENI
jgi:hypothetical protein